MNEPISISGALGLVLSTGLTLVTALWPDRLSPEAQTGILGFGNAVIWLGVIAYARLHSTPVAAPTVPTGTPITVTNPDPAVPDKTVIA